MSIFRDGLKLKDECSVSVTRKTSPMKDFFNFEGKFQCEHRRAGKLVTIYDWFNTIMDAAVNSLWNTMFNAASQVSAGSWVISLISGASFSAISAADTMGSHAGWLEMTGYSEAVRQPWGQGSAAARAITNASPVLFTSSGTATVNGMFITSQNTKAGTTGLLWCAGQFTGGPASVVLNDELRVTYAAGG